MLSLYIHIPFCNRKCEYCNFFVIAKDNPHRQDTMVDEYLTGLHSEIDNWALQIPDADIKTIYFGGGTPGLLSLSQLTSIIDHIRRVRNCENLGELSIELNPDPFDHTLTLVSGLTSTYHDIPRIRCSFGIQTFDDDILKQSNREYVFNNVRHFLRDLREIKQATNVFNLDFIAFGSWDKRSQARKDFMNAMVQSQSFDSYSLYLLELFPGSKRYSQLNKTNLTPLVQKLVHPDEDKVMEEYDAIASLLQSAGYKQYEVSNRSLAGKESIHNHTYRSMQPYLGLGASASGLIYKTQMTNSITDSQSTDMIRYTNTSQLTSYLKGDCIDPDKTTPLSDHDYHIEKLMLAMRTSAGITQASQFAPYFTASYEQLLEDRKDQGLIYDIPDTIILTHDGMKISNHLITDLLEFNKQ